MIEKKSPVRVVIYARHSTDRQTRSTQDQIDRCHRYCATAGYEVVAIYRDEGISGASLTNRPGIRELIEEALTGDFERVLAEDLSRFSRDQGDVAHFFKKMRFLDIHLETVAEGEINTLHIGLKGTMNAIYLSDLADKTHRGMIAAVLNGSIPGGRTFGYNVVHKLDSRGEPIRGLREINASEAAIVREIFETYSKGRALLKICADLNRRKIPSPKGGKWAQTTLVGQAARRTGLLRQTLYKGVVTFNRMVYRKHPDTGRRLSILRPESDWIYVPVPELAIMSEVEFNSVQKKIEERSSLRKNRMLLNKVMLDEEKAARRAARERYARVARGKQIVGRYKVYLTSRKLWCQRHNTTMHPVRARLYSCTAKGCPNRNLPLLDITTLILESLFSLDIPAGLSKYLAAQAQERESLQAQIDALENRLLTEREKMSNLLDALANRKHTEIIKAHLDKREEGIGRLIYDIGEARKKLSQLEISEPPAALPSAFNALIEPFRNNPLDQKATKRLSPVIKLIGIAAATDPANNSWRRWAEITYDWKNLLEVLRSPLPPRESPDKDRRD